MFTPNSTVACGTSVVDMDSPKPDTWVRAGGVATPGPVAGPEEGALSPSGVVKERHPACETAGRLA